MLQELIIPAADVPTPPTGRVVVFFDASNLNAFSEKRSDGSVAVIGAGGVLATPLTGLDLSDDTPIVATDNILEAFGKVQAQINDKEPTLGYTPENIANKTTDISGAAGTYPDTPTVKAYADLLGIRAVVASNTVAFDNPKQFGSVASPRTGALLVDYTGARNGLVAIVYHNDTTLSIPVSWTNISAISYTASQTNVICVAFIGNSKAVLTILGTV